MAKSLVGALALASLASLPSALAFRNTSPYFLFSTADLNLPADDADIARANAVVDQMTSSLDGCPTKTYFVVRQNGVSAADFSDASRSTPRLTSHLNGKSDYVKSTMVVPDVIEEASTASAISAYLQAKCGAEMLQGDAASNSEKQRVVQVSFPAPPPDSDLRLTQMGKNDQELQQLIEKYADFEDFTVIYTSTPQTKFQSEHPPYEMENPFGEAVQMELKRDLSAHKRDAKSKAGLFEKYQYFTPGLFMGLTAAVPLFLIVLVGVKALVSLEVSYFAFSKEMGPAAQRQQK
ncbi:BIG1-domain-containing protein [Bimuria novae-zelandiae CBS 107.79]|uniref:Protein BIG1 n=1 Tax=Bimuria novae-zelandiae CBS 107.79 TaxID=1447943 RepID=A0A6A5V2M5_9PLEO|nr:BIG1-domain-containing protein [Bimuria novae-zelandiae CBS 107.79]